MNAYAMQTIFHSTCIHHAEMHTIKEVKYLVISSGKKLEFFTFENNELVLYKSIKTFIPVIYFSPYKTKSWDGLILFSIDGQLSIYTFESNIYAHEMNLKTRITSLPITPENRIKKIINYNKITIILFNNSLITIVFQQQGKLNIQKDEKYFLGFQVIDLLVTNSLLFILLRSTSGRVNLYIYSIKNSKNPLTLLKVIPTQSDILFGKSNVFLNGKKGIKDLINDVYITNNNLIDQITASLETKHGILYTTPRGELIGIENKISFIYNVFKSRIDLLVEVSNDVFFAISKESTSYLFEIINGGYDLEKIIDLEILENFPSSCIKIIKEFENIGRINKIEYKNYLKIETLNANYEYKRILEIKIKKICSGKYNTFFNEELFILSTESNSYIYKNINEFIESLELKNKIIPIKQEKFIDFLVIKDKYFFIGNKSIFYSFKEYPLKLKNINCKFIEIIKMYKYDEILFICLNIAKNLSLYKFDTEYMKFNIIPINIPMNKIASINYIKEENIYLFITFDNCGYYINKEFEIINTIKCHILKEYIDINKYNIVYKYNELKLTNTIEIKTELNDSISLDDTNLFITKYEEKKESSIIKQPFKGVIELENNLLLFYGKECFAFDGKEFYYLELNNVLKIEKKENILYILTNNKLLKVENWILKTKRLIKKELNIRKYNNNIIIKNLLIKIKNYDMKSFIKVYKRNKKIQKILVSGYISVIKTYNNLIFISHGAYISIFKVNSINLILESKILVPIMPIVLKISNIGNIYFIYAIDIFCGFTLLEYNYKLKYIEIKTRDNRKIINRTINTINDLIFLGGESGICLYGNTNIQSRPSLNADIIISKEEKDLLDINSNYLICRFSININEVILCSTIKNNLLLFGSENGSVSILIPIIKDDWDFLLMKMKQFSQNFLFDFYDSISFKYSGGMYYSNIIDLDFLRDFPINIFNFSNSIKKRFNNLLKEINTCLD